MPLPSAHSPAESRCRVPGSRRSEVDANLPHLIEVMDGIRREFSNASFLIPTTAASHAVAAPKAAVSTNRGSSRPNDVA